MKALSHLIKYKQEQKWIISAFANEYQVLKKQLKEEHTKKNLFESQSGQNKLKSFKSFQSEPPAKTSKQEYFERFLPLRRRRSLRLVNCDLVFFRGCETLLNVYRKSCFNLV
jgi:hypothetical protein